MNEYFLYLITYISNNKNKSLVLRLNKELSFNDISNIIINTFKQKNININEIRTIEEINKANLYNGTEISNFYFRCENALKTFVYFDDYLKRWEIKFYEEINFRILDILNDKNLKLYLIGDKETNIFKSINKMNYINSLFLNVYNIKNINTLLFNTRKGNKIDFSELTNLLDIYKSNSNFSSSFKNNTHIIFCFDDTNSIFDIIEFIENINSICNKNDLKNIEVYMNKDTNFYKLDYSFKELKVGNKL